MPITACLQMCSTGDVRANLDQLEDLAARAARMGATLLASPENTTFLGPPAERLRQALDIGMDGRSDSAVCARLSGLARGLKVHLLIGSVAEIGPDPGHSYNTCLLYGPDGGLLARYRKIHRFDIDLPGARHMESATVAAGDGLVVVPTPVGVLGLSICYDVRFPGLYQRLVDRGAEILCVPSAFTVPTGQAHWHALLRARAIENQCFVVAPAQEGRHDPAGDRHSYGHSLIVDPWGVVRAECGAGPGLAVAEIDLAEIARVRRAMPVQHHRRAAVAGVPDLR